MPFLNSSTTNCNYRDNATNRERIISMKTISHKTRSLKTIFLCIGIAVTLCGSVQVGCLAAEEQAKQGRDFFDKAEPIVMKDPLAVLLGAMGRGDVFTYTYSDVVKFAGHSCPAVAGAYKSTQLALKSLYGSEVPVRGDIKVVLRGGPDNHANGPISQIITLITGAAAETGFKGFGANGKHGRYNLLSFDKESTPDPTATCSMIFQRVDTGKKVEVVYRVGKVPSNERLDKLMPLAISGKASEEELKEFGDLWQERVKAILLSPPEGVFSVKELKE